MSNTCINRLNQLECEIRQLLTIQKNHNEKCTSEKTNRTVKTKPKSSSEISGKSFPPSQTNCPKPKCKKIKKSKSEPDETSKIITDPCAADLDPSIGAEVKCTPGSCKKKLVIRCDFNKKKDDTSLQDMEILEQEIVCLKNVVNELKLCRDAAVQSCQKWKERYSELKQCNCACEKTWQALMLEKNCLAKSLEQEKEKLREAELLLHKQTGMQNSYKQLQKNYDELLKTVQDKNEAIFALEDRNAKLETGCIKISEDLKCTKQKYKDLEKTNKKFAKDIVNKYECFAIESANLSKTQNDKSKQYIARLKCINEKNEKMLQEERETGHMLRNQVESLQNQLVEAAEREQLQADGMTELEEKIELLQVDYKTLKEETDHNISVITDEKAKTHKWCNDLRNQIQDKEQAIWLCSSRCESLENALELTKSTATERETRLLAEIEAQRALAEELTEILKGHKDHIEELVHLNDKLKEASDQQTEAFGRKCEQLKHMEDQFKNSKAKYECLEKRTEMAQVDCGKASREVEEEIKVVKNSLQQKIDDLNVKDKIVNDQVITIKELKKKIADKDDIVANLYKEISLIKKEKNEIHYKMSEILKENVSLKEDLHQTRRDMARQNVIIANMEKKLSLQQREWELQSELHLREKQRAVTAAKFATEKLVETMYDFQKQTDSQNQVRSVLTNLLHDKDSKLKSAIVKMSSWTLDPDMVVRTATEKRKCSRDSSCRRHESRNNESSDTTEDVDGAQYSSRSHNKLSLENFGPYQCMNSRSSSQTSIELVNKRVHYDKNETNLGNKKNVTVSDNKKILMIPSSQNSSSSYMNRCKPKCHWQKTGKKKS